MSTELTNAINKLGKSKYPYRSYSGFEWGCIIHDFRKDIEKHISEECPGSYDLYLTCVGNKLAKEYACSEDLSSADELPTDVLNIIIRYSNAVLNINMDQETNPRIFKYHVFILLLTLINKWLEGPSQKKREEIEKLNNVVGNNIRLKIPWTSVYKYWQQLTGTIHDVKNWRKIYETLKEIEKNA